MTASLMSPRLSSLSDLRQTIKRQSHEIVDGAFSDTDGAGFECVRQTDCSKCYDGSYSSRLGAGRPDRITNDRLTGAPADPSVPAATPAISAASPTSLQSNANPQGVMTKVGVGMTITDHPLHGSGRADFPHPALASGDDAEAA